MNPVRMVEGIPVADMAIAADVLAQRYHCGPHEELVIAEVLCRKEKRLARELHRKWDAEMSEFVEMMQVRLDGRGGNGSILVAWVGRLETDIKWTRKTQFETRSFVCSKRSQASDRCLWPFFVFRS